ncbi:MAG TPA: type II secretion system protein GspG [Baekduia sp.]
MADLKNAQRISYKATYNQISAQPVLAPPDGKGGHGHVKTPPLLRAVEKAAFVQALRIVPEELPPLGRRLRKGGEEQARALDAIEQLVDDRTATSTLNNAQRFADIDPSTLVAVGEALLVQRDAVSAAIDAAVARILAAYRASLTAAAAPPAAGGGGPQAPAGQAATTAAGVHVIASVTPVAQPAPDDATRESRGVSAHMVVDDAKGGPPGLSSIAAGTALAAHVPSNAAALTWAEQHEPKLFADLTKRVAPYLGLSDDQRVAVGGAKAVADFLAASHAATFDHATVKGAVQGFQSRMTIEPVGNLHLERIEMYPAGVERGELVHSVPLAPGETVNISHKEWSVSEKEFEDIVDDYFEGYSEEGVAEKTDIAMSNDSQSQHSTALNLGASLSASYSSVTLTTSFGYSTASNETQSKKDSRNHSMALTRKASSRTKKDHKVTFKVTSVAGSEDQTVRIIANASDTDAMRIDYFQLARRWKLDLLRYGLRMTYDIVIPNPGAGIVRLVQDVKALDAVIDTPFTFTLPLTAITYNSLAADPSLISNYDQLAADYDAAVTAPPVARKWVNVHKETPEGDGYGDVHFDAVEFDIDDNYYIYEFQLEHDYEHDVGDDDSYLRMLGGETIEAGVARLIGRSGHLSLDLEYQYVYSYGITITFSCRPKVQVLLDWRLQVWNQIRQAAEEQYAKSIQNYTDQRSLLLQQIADFDALTLRRMEQEEIMKGVLRWLLGPQFDLVPFDLSSLFGPDASDPGVTDVLDPNRLTDAEWLDVMTQGEFIKYVHNAIEWENVLSFTYPYFWDDNRLWDFKKFLSHPDATHRTFLRSGAARVVLTIRPGFEASFTTLIESGSFGALPAAHPYVTIAQEIQDFANTNYPGFPPANPEQDARPLLYLEQRRVWKEMQYVIQLLNAAKAATGAFPPDDPGHSVPVAALAPYLDGAIVVNGQSYNGINDYNTQANAQQLALDPTTPQEALLPTYASVPVNDTAWGNPYFYQCPGDTGDYDLISFGADGQPLGEDKDADISANAEASLISTWFEYTPLNALDIGITMNPPGIVPPQPSSEIA